MGFKVASRVRGLSDEAFREAFGAEEQCRSALSRLRWPDGFVCPACGHRGHCVLAGRSLYQCYRCKKQTSSTADTIFHATKLPLTLWFAAVHLIVTAKNGISSVELGRRLGVKQPTAWTMKHKIMAVMARREADTPLSGRVEMDDAYLGGARAGGKRGRGAPGKTPFVAAVSTSPEGRPRKVKLVPVKGFRKREIARGAKRWLAPGSEVLTDGLRCWNALDGVVGSHRAIRTGSGRQAARMAPFKWVNTTLGNIKSAITGTYRKLGPDHAQRYLASFAWRYNRRYQLLRTGTLEVVDWSGTVHHFGNGDRPFVRIRLHKRSLGWRLPLYPELKTGEAYMDGSLTIEDGSIYDFLDLVTMNLGHGRRPAIMRLTAGLGFALRAFYPFNIASRARATTARHYDLSAALYELFLDRDRQYSCAYFTRPHESLDEAQENKKRRIAAKLGLEPGQRILDIGSGWGGMALYLAREAGADVTGVTLSTMQRELAERRANETGLSERAHFFLRDYRQQTGTFERIVSVGMFEHVGVNHYREFFAKLGELLADDGIAVLHTIGHAGPPAEADPWIRKYIFPGAYIPSLSEVAGAIEMTGLVITDIEVLRLHYAETLRHWRERFAANREAVKKLYDERFCQMWEYYLAASEVSFRNLDNVVFQIQLAKRADAVPLTRDYLASWNAPQTEDAGVSARRSA